MPKIFLIRPGQTQEQRDGRLIGRFDADLDDAGRRQADRIGLRLASTGLTRVVTSPLKRSLSVAMAVCEQHDRVPRLVKSFDGVDLGDWENRLEEDVVARDSLRYHKWIHEPEFPCPGGESLRHVYRRAFPQLVEIVSDCDSSEEIAVVAPGVVLKCLCCGIMDLDLKSSSRFSLDFGGISVFDRGSPDHGYRLRRWNDTQHLHAAFEQTVELESDSQRGES